MKNQTANFRFEPDDGVSVIAIIERKRIKNFHIKVTAAGEVRVSAPLYASDRQITELLRAKSAWIKKCLEREKPAPLQPQMTEAAFVRYVLGALDRLYPIVEAYGVKKPNVTLRRMKTRWGSCTVNRASIRINWYLVYAPSECIDYVVLHELAHFIHPDHSNRFYAFLEQAMPDWKSRREKLKRIALPERSDSPD